MFSLNNLLSILEQKKKEKALRNWPWRYEDKQGRRWFNTQYRVSWNSLRKWC